MVIHGYRAVFMVFKVPGPLNGFFLNSWLVFHDSRWVFRVFQGSMMVFKCSRWVFIFFQGD